MLSDPPPINKISFITYATNTQYIMHQLPLPIFISQKTYSLEITYKFYKSHMFISVINVLCDYYLSDYKKI